MFGHFTETKKEEMSSRSKGKECKEGGKAKQKEMRNQEDSENVVLVLVIIMRDFQKIVGSSNYFFLD